MEEGSGALAASGDQGGGGCGALGLWAGGIGGRQFGKGEGFQGERRSGGGAGQTGFSLAPISPIPTSGCLRKQARQERAFETTIRGRCKVGGLLSA